MIQKSILETNHKPQVLLMERLFSQTLWQFWWTFVTRSRPVSWRNNSWRDTTKRVKKNQLSSMIKSSHVSSKIPTVFVTNILCEQPLLWESCLECRFFVILHFSLSHLANSESSVWFWTNISTEIFIYPVYLVSVFLGCSSISIFLQCLDQHLVVLPLQLQHLHLH